MDRLSELSQIELGWLSGLFEGEGCIYITPDKRIVRLTVPSVDLDTIEKFRDTVGFGAIHQQRYTTRDGQPRVIHRWQSGRLADVQRLLRLMEPHLSARRAEKARLALTVIPNPNGKGPRKLRTHCQRGHEMAGDNLLTGRRCRACRDLREGRITS